MAYPWTVVGTVFNARYGLFRPRPKKQMASAMHPFRRYVHIKKLQKHPYFVKTWRKVLDA